MNYSKIRKMDISNGPGIRVSIFMQGCTFNCPNCFNPDTHDFEAGTSFDDNVINRIMDLCKSDTIVGLSILGGEPLHPKNIDGTTNLAKKFKEVFPNKNLWLWSGYIYDEYIDSKEIINYIDVIVDGRYEDDLHNYKLKWRGSSNQRVIDVKESIKKSSIILYEK